MLIVEADRGYLSSSVTAKTGCGSTACPWQVYAPSGQKIDIFLWDFQYGKVHQGTAVMKFVYFHMKYINNNDDNNSNDDTNNNDANNNDTITYNDDKIIIMNNYNKFNNLMIY